MKYSLTALSILVLGIAASNSTAQMPGIPGFTEVRPGTVRPRPNLPPVGHPLGLTVQADSLGARADQRPGSAFQVTGRVRADSGSVAGQLAILERPAPGAPVAVTLRLPFDLAELIPQSTGCTLQYQDRFGVVEYDRDLTLLLAADRQLQIIQRGGTEPLILRAGGTNLGTPGLVVRQGASAASTVRPSRTHNFPLPVEVQVGNGSVTALWQGEWMDLPGDPDDPTVRLIVLVSEVARPTGDAAAGFEGAPFNMQLLLVTARE